MARRDRLGAALADPAEGKRGGVLDEDRRIAEQRDQELRHGLLHDLAERIRVLRSVDDHTEGHDGSLERVVGGGRWAVGGGERVS